MGLEEMLKMWQNKTISLSAMAVWFHFATSPFFSTDCSRSACPL